MKVSLDATGLYQRLAPNIFSSSQVKNGKPAPDLFLSAAAEMTVPPERGVVIEEGANPEVLASIRLRPRGQRPGMTPAAVPIAGFSPLLPISERGRQGRLPPQIRVP